MAILLIITSVCLTQVSGSNFFMLPQPMTALDAYTACKENNSILALPGKDDIETLDTVLNNTESLGAWTGEYVDFAPWAFAKGCYGSLSSSGHNTSYSGSTCLQSCDKNTNVVFVKSKSQVSQLSEEAECICYTEKTKEMNQSPYSSCSRPCSRDGGACGGVGRYTDYHRCFRNECESDSPIKHNCMYTNLSGEMKTADCEEQHFPICKKGKGKGDLDLFVNKTDDLQKMSWKDANSFCRKHGGVLADLSDGVGSLKGRWEDLTQSPPSSMFWIALNRANTTTKLLMENSTLGNSSRCLYIRKELRESKNCSQRAFASCRKNMNVTQIPDSTPSPAIDSKPSTADNSTPSIADNRTPSPATKPIIIYIVIPSVVVVIAVIGTVIFILARKRKKTSRALQHETRQQYDYTEIGGGQTPGRFGLQMQVVETSTNAASGSGLNIETHGYETETMDEGNYDKLDKKSNIKQKSNVCESNAYERAFPMQDGIYNEMQTGTDNGKEGARDSFYATAQSCSTREGNYDEFQKRNMSTGAEGAESDYDHVIHKTD